MALETASSQKFFADPADPLLADAAIRVQLGRTDYNKAVSRYGTINDWIERHGSVLNDRVELFDPQGSMAIGATVASRLRSDAFDIDVIAQLDFPFDVSPQAPPGYVPMLEAMSVLGVSRQAVLQRVTRGELNAINIRAGRKKALCIKVVDDQPSLFA